MGSDPIADLLTRIRNASAAKHLYLDVSHSNILEAIVKILVEKGFLAHHLIKEENKRKTMRVFLKYTPAREPVIHQLKRVSTPSLRKYIKSKDIPLVFGGVGISILSTSQGVMDGQTAHEQNRGGELLCLVW